MILDYNYLDKKRAEGDKEADRLIKSIYPKNLTAELHYYLHLPPSHVNADAREGDIKDFILQRRPLPVWFDKERLIAGQKFYTKFAAEIMMLLGAMSLPYCYAASPGNKAIYLTGKMNKIAGKRLLETAQFIISVMREGSFEEEGEGWIQVNRTRMIHAMVRYYLQHKSKWDDTWGLPINQEDMAGTNLAFSYIIILGLKKWGFKLTAEETEDFLFSWRFIGYLLHIDGDLLPESFNEAQLLEQTIKARHFNRSEEGVLLTAELIKHYKSSFRGVGSYFVDGQIRYFLGPEISDLLGLKRQRLKDFFIQVLNIFTTKANAHRKKTSSYQTMIKDHERLKKIYAQ